nr:PadR family transcriptional regulator [Maliibacterium massiliense]
MSLKHGLLGLLHYGEMTGYELDRAFKSSLAFFWHAQTSQVYRELDAMQQRGWLTSRVVVQQEKPNKRVYALTRAGEEEFLRWLAQDHVDMRIKHAFLMQLFFSGVRPPHENIALLERYIQAHEQALRDMAGVAQSVAHYAPETPDAARTTFYWQASADFGRRYMQMNIDWARDTIAAIREKLL